MKYSIAGLSEQQLRRVLFFLAQSQPDLAELFFLCVGLLDRLTDLVLTEMNSLRRDALYWDHLAKATRWEGRLHRFNSSLYRRILSPFSVHSFPPLLASEKDPSTIERRVIHLTAVFNELATFLVAVNDSASCLKKIFLEMEFLDLDSTANRVNDGRDHNDFLRRTAVRHMSACLSMLQTSLSVGFKGSSLIVASETVDRHADQVAGSPVHSVEDLFSLSDQIQSQIDSFEDFCIDPNYPLSLTETTTRRPSNYERFWLRNLLLSCSVAYGLHLLLRSGKNGSLQSAVDVAVQTITSSIRDHIFEPIQKLATELLLNIRPQEGMVSRAELRESRQALSRMLADFSSSQAGYELIIERLKEQSSHLFGGSKDKISSTGSATTSNSSTVMTPAQQKVVADAKNNMNGKNIDEAIRSLDPTEAQAMDALMNLYEKELQTPMRGLLFGSLMTAMLIQMQKLKVHTEAAMVTMDQVLTSNQLTMAVTAAIPAFALLGGFLYWVRRAAFSSTLSPSIRSLMQRFELIMSDVERALHSVDDLLAAKDRVRVQNFKQIEEGSYGSGHNQDFPLDSDNENVDNAVLMSDELPMLRSPRTRASTAAVYAQKKRKTQSRARTVFQFDWVPLSVASLGLFWKTDPATEQSEYEVILEDDKVSPRPGNAQVQHFTDAVQNNTNTLEDQVNVSSSNQTEEHPSVVLSAGPNRNVSEMSEDEHFARELAIARGMLVFHLLRLSTEFKELFHVRLAAYRTWRFLHLPAAAAKSAQNSSDLLEGVGMHANRWLTLTTSDSGKSSRRRKFLAHLQNMSSLPLCMWNLMLPYHQSEIGVDEAEGLSNTRMGRMLSRTESSTALSISRRRRHSAVVFLAQLWTPIEIAKQITLAMYGIIFGSNELQTTTTPYYSLSQDLLLLESPEVSIRGKLATASRMRKTADSLSSYSPV